MMVSNFLDAASRYLRMPAMRYSLTRLIDLNALFLATNEDVGAGMCGRARYLLTASLKSIDPQAYHSADRQSLSRNSGRRRFHHAPTFHNSPADVPDRIISSKPSGGFRLPAYS